MAFFWFTVFRCVLGLAVSSGFYAYTEYEVSGDTRASYKPPAFVSSVKPYINKSGLKYYEEWEIWPHPVHTWAREDLTLTERVTGEKCKRMRDWECAPYRHLGFPGEGNGKRNKRKTHQLLCLVKNFFKTDLLYLPSRPFFVSSIVSPICELANGNHSWGGPKNINILCAMAELHWNTGMYQVCFPFTSFRNITNSINNNKVRG